MTIPVATSGRTCSDPVSGTTVQFVDVGGTVTLGSVALTASTLFMPSSNSAVGNTTDSGDAAFQELTFPSGATVSTGTGSPFPSLGSCLVNNYVIPPFSAPPPPPPAQTFADAGPAINFTGPNGLASAPPHQGILGDYEGPLSLITGQPFIPASGGTFTIDNGSGGTGVGAFKQQVTVPPPLTWTNIASVGPTIDRTQPLTIQWIGGDPSSYVEIVGVSQIPMPTGTSGASFQCTAPASTGKFTVPSAVLMTLPPQPDQYATEGGPNVRIFSSTGAMFTAPGIVAGLISVGSTVELAVGLQ